MILDFLIIEHRGDSVILGCQLDKTLPISRDIPECGVGDGIN